MKINKDFKIYKISILFILVILTVTSSFLYGIYSGLTRNNLYIFANSLKKHIEISFDSVWHELEIIIFDEAVHHSKKTKETNDGVVVNNHKNNDEFILLSGMFDGENGLKLIDRNGKLIASWQANFYDHFPRPKHLRSPPRTNNHVALHGALINKDGSVVFNYDYAGTVKLDNCGKIIWTLSEQTHHSVEKSENGGYWIGSRREIKSDPNLRLFPFKPFYVEDLIIKVSEDGKIEKTISVPEILKNNQLFPILTSIGHNMSELGIEWDREIVHLNKIGELKSNISNDYKNLEKGDLIISERTYNLILIFSPKTLKVKWYRVGPWVRQHDPEFFPNGEVHIFNNNSYDLIKPNFLDTEKSENSSSNIIKFNLNTEIGVVRPIKEPFFSRIQGKLEPSFDYKRTMITVSENGTVLEVDNDGNLLWKFVNKVPGGSSIQKITEARSYPKSFFRNDFEICLK